MFNFTKTMTKSKKQFLSELNIQWLEYYEERAAILEHEAGMTKEEAEHLAWMETSAALLKTKWIKQ